MYKRHQFGILNSRISEPRRFIQVISGPRQTGKSTLVRQVLKETDIPFAFETADDVPDNNPAWISQVWESARLTMEFNGHKEFLLVIDEIQKLGNWSETVKKEWDRDTFNELNLKVILLGSSRLLLKKRLTESLAGRFELIRMGHWSYREMKEAFGWDLKQYVYFGGYPGSAGLISDESRWRSYIKDSIIEPSISKDVLMTTVIYKPALLRQLFGLGCSYSGELLSLNKMLGQLQDAGNVTTLASYLNVLDECGLLTTLHKYAKDQARKYSSIPKYQVYNSALSSIYSGKGFKESFTDSRHWGRCIESATGAWLAGNADKIGYRLYYWRDKADEVDFVLEKDSKTIAIEVKSGHSTMNAGLPAFQKMFNPQLAFVVGSGGVSIEDFLQADLAKLF